MNKNVKKKRKGFTLIELIIVLAIMAIIAAIAIPNFSAVRDNSKVKADTQSAETIKRTMLMLISDETIKVTADTTFVASFNSDGSIDSVTNDTSDKKIEEALKDVKKPQGKTVNTSMTATGTAANATKYGISVTAATGDVSVKPIQ